MNDWIKRAVRELLDGWPPAAGFGPLTVERMSEVIAAEHSRWLCERLNRVPVDGIEAQRIADIFEVEWTGVVFRAKEGT